MFQHVQDGGCPHPWPGWCHRPVTTTGGERDGPIRKHQPVVENRYGERRPRSPPAELQPLPAGLAVAGSLLVSAIVTGTVDAATASATVPIVADAPADSLTDDWPSCRLNVGTLSSVTVVASGSSDKPDCCCSDRCRRVPVNLLIVYNRDWERYRCLAGRNRD